MTNDRTPGFCVFVSWTECVRKGGEDVRLFFSQPYPVADGPAANALFVRINRELDSEDHGGWAPRYGFDIEVTARGPGLKVQQPAPEVTRGGIASVRAALAAHGGGPLFNERRRQETVG